MSQPSVIWWQPCVGNEGSIAALQNVAVGGNVILNPGHPETPGTFTYNKMIRSILFDSPDDLSGVTFVISGIGSTVDANGNPDHILSPITENLIGGNAVPVESLKIYSQITSITATVAPATNLTVGFGRFGITDYVFYDYNRTSTSFSTVSLQFISQISMTAAVFISLNKPESPNISQGGVLVPHGTENDEYITFIPAFQIIGPAETKNAIMTNNATFTIIWTAIKDTSLAAAESLYFTFVQQGVKS